MEDKLLKWAEELQSLAQAGLYYGKDVFDLERYERIREISAEMMAEKTGLPLADVKVLLCSDSGYQTPKIDTRAAIIKDGKLLMVQESSGLWTIPGGWCEFNLTPSQNAVKEAKEEAGRDIRIKSLVGYQKKPDSAEHFPFAITKIFFLCEELGGELAPNSETIDARWFTEEEIKNLPLAVNKVSEAQIHLCFEASENPDWKAIWD